MPRKDQQVSRKTARVALLGVLAVALLAAPACARAAESVDLIVGRDPGLSARERAEIRADAGVTYERRLRLSDAEVVSVPAEEAEAALRELRADPDVRWAQRDAGVRATAVTGADTYWSLLWGLDNTGQAIDGQAGLSDADMDAPEAWQTATGAGVTVGVVDTGADAAHPDLASALATNPGETGSARETNGIDDDGDGLVDDWRGWDFAYDDNNPSDVNGHGSHVSGTIAARNGDAIGISGLAPDAKVLMLKGLGDTGSGTWSDLADAFDFAGDQGIRVVNASLGGVGSVPAIDAVIAQHPNTLYVVSAGNDGADLDASTYYPCEAVEANVLCVGAADNRDERAGFSNHSPTAVDVFAPGVDVLSSTLGSYWYYSGTSMAAPHVTAEAALLLSRDATLTAAQVKQAILDSAEPKAQLAAYGHNGGRANARAALELLFSPDADADGDGIADRDDGCPAQPGPAGNGGCPVAVVAPPVTPPAQAVPDHVGERADDAPLIAEAPRATVTPARCRTARPCRRTVVTVTLSRPATVAITVTGKACRKGRCASKKVAGATATGSGKLTLTARTPLKAGRYRVLVAVTGVSTRTLTLTVPRR
jgi:subtilisin family serine protease